MASQRLVELGKAIQENTTKLNKYYSSRGIPQPSFDVKAPLDVDLPKDIKACRSALVEDTDELHSLVLGPQQMVNWLREMGSPILQVLYRFKIPFAFPLDETATFEQIAEKCGRGEDEIKRILRLAMTYHLFTEPEPGVVAHTAATKALVEKPLFNAWIGMWLEEMTVSLAHMADAMERWPASQEPNEAAFNLAHNTESEVYQELSKDPKRAVRFKDAMEYFQTAPGFETEHVLSSFDWSSLKNATVVDVGGSHGVSSIQVARQNPSLKFIVQDRAEVINAADLPKDVADRVSFVPYDFFEEQPVQGADVYFYRWIFHNWSDKYCIKICQAVIPALKPGARLLIQDILLPEPGELSLFQERKARWTDIGMLGMANSKERDRNDWIQLFKQADPRFSVKNIITPPKSELSMVEVVWDEGAAGGAGGASAASEANGGSAASSVGLANGANGAGGAKGVNGSSARKRQSGKDEALVGGEEKTVTRGKRTRVR